MLPVGPVEVLLRRAESQLLGGLLEGVSLSKLADVL